MSKKITWDDVAILYRKKTGGNAKIRPMDDIFAWAIKQPEIKENKDGTLSFRN